MLTVTRRVGESVIIGEGIVVTRDVVDGMHGLRFEVPGHEPFFVCTGRPRSQQRIMIDSASHVRRSELVSRRTIARVYEP